MAVFWYAEKALIIPDERLAKNRLNPSEFDETLSVRLHRKW